MAKEIKTSSAERSVNGIKMSENEMVEFVNNNINVVPKIQSKKFNALELKDKVTKIQFYIDMQRMREDAKIKNSVLNRTKDLFEKRRASIEDATAVMKYCQEFIDSFKAREIEKLDEQIRQLELMKQSIL